MTTTAANTAPLVVGHALYLELIKGIYTTQIVLTPEGISSSHKKVPMGMYRRRLSTIQPKKQWKFAVAASSSAPVVGVTPPSAHDVAQNYLRYWKTYLDGFAAQEWTLFGKPIIVEVTAEDLEDVRLAKTPYKVLGRVWKVRKALGFPKEFLHTK